MSLIRGTGQAVVAATLAVGVACGLGWASRLVYIAGLWPLTIGLAAGAGAAFAALVLGGLPGRGPRVAAVVASVLGLGTLAAMDDLHFRAAWRADLAAARFADSGAGPTEALEADEVAFWGDNADVLLDAQAMADTGAQGFAGRWLLRADAGVRLFGGWQASRGLPVGVWGAAIWSLLELALAIAVALGVIRRVERRLLAPQPAPTTA